MMLLRDIKSDFIGPFTLLHVGHLCRIGLSPVCSETAISFDSGSPDILTTCSATLSASCSYISPGWPILSFASKAPDLISLSTALLPMVLWRNRILLAGELW